MASDETVAERWARWHEGQGGVPKASTGEAKYRIDATKKAIAATKKATKSGLASDHYAASMAHGQAGLTNGLYSNARPYHDKMDLAHRAASEGKPLPGETAKGDVAKWAEKKAGPPQMSHLERSAHEIAHELHKEGVTPTASHIADVIHDSHRKQEKGENHGLPHAIKSEHVHAAAQKAAAYHAQPHVRRQYAERD
jgi:hypothetical protein